MTLRTALSQGAELLAKAGVPEPELTAGILLGHAVHCERVYFYAHPEQELREVEWLHFGRYLHERMKGKPTQYITRRQEFYGLEFRVTPDVLIPRPETELLVETVLKRRADAGAIVDVGTGSGAIAVALKLGQPGSPLYACDVSGAALTVAKGNAERLGAQVRFIQTDLLSAFAPGSMDVVVSNPPYVPLSDREELQREVRDWEPHLALFAGECGLEVYEKLIPEAWRVLKPGGLLALELGFGLADKVRALAGRWDRLEILPDLAGIPRVLSCEKPRSES